MVSAIDRTSRPSKGWIGVLLLWLTAVLLTTLGTAVAQEPTARFDRLTVDDGLSHPRVYSVLQDSRGFFWIGTGKGLNRYDGYRFEVYRHDADDPGSLAFDVVLVVYEDSRDRLWIGTRGNGLDRFDRASETFVHYRGERAAGRLAAEHIWDIVEDRSGTLWVGASDGLYALASQEDRFTRYSYATEDLQIPGEGAIWDVHEDRQGRLWVATDQGLGQFDRVEHTFVSYRFTDEPVLPGQNEIQQIRDAENWLWVATRAGLRRVDPETGSSIVYRHDPDDLTSLGQDEIRDFLRTRDGRFWIGTISAGLDLFDPSTGTFRHFRHDPADSHSLSHDGTGVLYEDRSGMLWIGTLDGLARYDRRREQFRIPTLSGSWIYDIHEDRFGELWVGTREGGLNRLDAGRTQATHYRSDPRDPDSLTHDTVIAVHVDRAGDVWVGTAAGLDRLDRESGRFRHHRHEPGNPHSLTSDYVTALHEDAGGRLWIGTVQGLQYLGDDRERSVRYPRDASQRGLDKAFFTDFAEDANGLWIGTLAHGLCRLEGTVQASIVESGRFSCRRHDPHDPTSLPSDKVGVLHLGADGHLWMGSDGLIRFDPARNLFTRYGEAEGLPDEQIAAIAEDERGDLWIATGHGLSHFDPRGESFRNFDTDDGLPSNSFTLGAGCRGATGELIFGTNKGLVTFRPEVPALDPHPPLLAITDFRLANRSARLVPSILERREIVLDHRDKVFSFELAAFHYKNPRQNRYAYHLEGFDDDWIMTDADHRVAQYSNLPPGEYVFRMKASNGDGVWNEEGTSVRVVMRPPPWRTWWAFSLYALALAFGLFVYLRAARRKIVREREINRRLREADRLKSDLLDDLERRVAERTSETEALMRDLEERNAELENFTYTVSHDLRSPLVTIRGFLGYLELDAKSGDTERLERDLQHISGAIDKMEVLLEDLLELSRIGRKMNPPEDVSLGQLACDAVELLGGQLDAGSVVVEVDAGLTEVRGDATRLLQVFQNLIGNAAKYMGDEPMPRIEVGQRPGEDSPVFYVRDNGIGIDPRHHETIFGLFQRLDADNEGTGVGLALARRIVEFHGGEIWVESEGPGHGSTFCFTLGTEA